MTFVLLKENKTYQHSTVYGVDVKAPASHSHAVVRRLQFIQAHSRRRHQVWNVNNNGDFPADGTRNGVSIAIIAALMLNFSDVYFPPESYNPFENKIYWKRITFGGVFYLVFLRERGFCQIKYIAKRHAYTYIRMGASRNRQFQIHSNMLKNQFPAKYHTYYQI